MNTRAREEEGEGEEQPLRAVDGVSWGVYRRSAIVMGAVFGVCLAVLHMAEHSGVRWLPLTVWWPPVTMREDAFLAPWYTSNKTAKDNATVWACPVAYHRGSWTRDAVAGAQCQDTKKSIYIGCSLVAERRWRFQEYDGYQPPESHVIQDSDVFRKASSISFVGDSIARKVLVSLLESMHVERKDLVFTRHSDYTYVGGGVTVHLHWAPFPENATALLQKWSDKNEAPDVVILSVSLWHMLHIHNTSLFEQDIAGLRQAVVDHRNKTRHQTNYILMSSPEVYNDHLKSLQKKKYMTYSNTDAYNNILVQSGLFREHGNGPCTMLDVFRVTHDCGAECSQDGIHSRDSVYRVVVQILFNILKYCVP